MKGLIFFASSLIAANVQAGEQIIIECAGVFEEKVYDYEFESFHIEPKKVFSSKKINTAFTFLFKQGKKREDGFYSNTLIVKGDLFSLSISQGEGDYVYSKTVDIWSDRLYAGDIDAAGRNWGNKKNWRDIGFKISRLDGELEKFEYEVSKRYVFENGNTKYLMHSVSNDEPIRCKKSKTVF